MRTYSFFLPAITRRQFLVWSGALAGVRFCPTIAGESADVAPQPYFAAVNRAVESLEQCGAPIAASDAHQLAMLAHQGDSAAVQSAEKILDRYTLARVTLEPDGFGRAQVGGARRTLVEQGWRPFLLRIWNPKHNTNRFDIVTGLPVIGGPSSSPYPPIPDPLSKAAVISRYWLLSDLPDSTKLSGFPLEYRVVQLYSRDRGRHNSYAAFGAGDSGLPGGMPSATFAFALRRGECINPEFDCLPSRDVKLGVLDNNGRGCVASLIVKDRQGMVYPAKAMRLAPDMFFQDQVYRADGETLRLPDGEYTVTGWRGPEYLRDTQMVAIGDDRVRIDIKLKRWIDPAQWGWYSGDPHIHAAGCAHYDNPTQGVSPETIIRHVRGEALSIGDILTWGPAWEYQKQFFSGHAESPPAALEHPELQVANSAAMKPQPTPEDGESLLRYDIETSGFPSSHAGHLVLLRLKQQDYPRAESLKDWPSWNLPILKWAKEQGAVGGYAHCAGGLVVESRNLPNYIIPPFDNVGANEAIVDVTHGFAEFLGGGHWEPVSELNIWYHLLNCGFRLSMTGETDWPCYSSERPGVGRTYVKLDRRPVGDAGYDAWVTNLQQGRHYFGDGRTHFLNFYVNSSESGADLVLEAGGTVEIKATIAARLEPTPTPETKAITDAYLPNWHLERARIGSTREVAVELVINGRVVDKQQLLADGSPADIHFRADVAHSSWISLRVLPSGHTNPVFVTVGKEPIRASKRSAEWCRACVDKVWEVKAPFIRESEKMAAAEAFEHARRTYDKLIAECESA